MFDYSCPACTQRLLAPRERIGQRTICPKCLQPLTVPKPDFSEDSEQRSVDLDATPPKPSTCMSSALTREIPQAPKPEEMSFVFPAKNVSVTEEQEEALLQPASAVLVAELAEEPVLVDLQPLVEALEECEAAKVSLPPNSRKSVSEDTGTHVILNPTGLFPVDAVAELSATISMRMKPPPSPSTDLRLTTGALLVAIPVLLIAWVTGILYIETLLPYVLLLSGSLVVFGYVWQAYVAGLGGHWGKSLVALFPPVSFFRLARGSGVVGHRPLLYVLIGVIGLGLYSFSPTVRATVHAKLPPDASDLANSEPETPLSKLKHASAHKQYEDLLPMLKTFAEPEKYQRASAKERDELGREFLKLTECENSDVRKAALLNALQYSPRDCSAALVKMMRSPDPAERSLVYPSAHKCPKPEVIAVLVERLKESADRRIVQPVLERIGAPAEQAILDALEDFNDLTKLTAIEVLAQIGTQLSVSPLRREQASSDNRAIRLEAERAVLRIKTRSSE